MDMTLEDLFASALVALGPPHQIPSDVNDLSMSSYSQFSEGVQEYNRFMMNAGYVVFHFCSYYAYSRWFHARRSR